MSDDNILAFRPRPYRTAESTIDAFWHLVRLKDSDRLAAWLDDHPRDASFLYELLESQQCQ
jgi:hypothetical protein